ncbi:hypothetical protein F4821DRAFT_281491 [Hypoxylon rubiginosum]|uniref:Uncharacterized protein n=1 Tax=Hypoxylon rubiginosum TaxID=110542 RepID=A0ACC0CQT5_9PEZI|nr:hypothetical protein F4821DRAFT_281491 [Hypoxylon rubiginosum]
MSYSPGQVRPILGENIDIGCFYDGYTDSFLPSKLIAADIPGEFASFTQVSERHVQISTDDSLVQKFKQLEISHELGASYLTGLVPVNGAAYYLVHRHGSSQVIQGAIQVTATEEKLDLVLRHGGINNHLSAEASQCKDGTHIVTGITFGARVIISVKVPYQDHKNSSNQRLGVSLDLLKAYVTSQIALDGQVNGESVLPTTEVLESSFGDFSFALFSDITGMECLQNLSIQEILRSIRSLPFHFQQTKKPISCKLLATENIQMVVDIKLSDNRQVTQVPNEFHEELFRLVGEWDSIEEKSRDLLANPELSRSELTLLRNECKARSLARHSFLDAYKEALIDARRGSSSLEPIVTTLRDSDSDKSRQKFVSIIDETTDNLKFRKRIVDQDGKLLDYEGAQKAISTGSNIYVFYFTEGMKREKESWEANQDIFFNLLKRNSGDYLVVAAHCNAKDIAFTKPRVTSYSRCEVVIEDMLDALDLADQSFARYDSGALDTGGCPRPTNRRLVRIPCPKKSCGNGARDWNCYKCRTPLEYHEGKIYCNCGRAEAKSYKWQCSSDKHGKSFAQYGTMALKSRLEKLHSYKDLNILILGETGVGKSTWINAFYNYMMFKTLDEAMNHNQLEYVIPSSFSMQYVDKTDTGSRFVEKDVRVGEFTDAEADGTRGNSGTQKAGVYRIPIRDTVVRLIDTPGVGDVRGIEADRKNLNSILRTINRVGSLHGIIILLKPNASRLTLMFRFCVKELLTYLHRDAAQNIVWGFTNTRQSGYMPGDTLQPLRTLLQENESLGLTVSPDTVFCFDSESFRYLAAKKQAQITMPNQDDFRQSWKKSVDETHRLLEYLSSNKPHSVSSTLSLNRARELISLLTSPMADVADVIERTIKLNQDEINELRGAKDRRDALKKSLHYSRIDIEVKGLDRPRTVCKNSGCVDMKDVAGVKRPVYRSLCHDPCYLTEVQEEVVGHAELTQCSAFKGKMHCQRDNCGHHWQEHLHIRFSQTEKVTQVIDQEVKAKLTSHKSTIQIKKEGIRSRETRIRGFKAELEEIRNAAAHFGLFLKKHSIVAYNDAMVRYLDELIKEERQTIASYNSVGEPVEKNEARLEDLEKSRKGYQERINVIEEQIEFSGDATLLDEQGVEDMVTKLYSLPTWGKNIQSIRSAVEWSKAADFHEQALQPKIHESVINNMKWLASSAATKVSSAVTSAMTKIGIMRGSQRGTAQTNTSSPSVAKRQNSNAKLNEERRKSRRIKRSPSP